MKINIGILTLSDRASKNEYEDLSGKAIMQLLDGWITNEISYRYEVIPDELDKIVTSLESLANECDLVLTTGGTGPALRDVTPEAMEKVCDKILPGFGEQMRMESLKFVPTAILSRQTAGVKGSCLIVNLPGQPKAIRECLEPIFPAIPYCIDLIGGNYIECNESMKVFRPKKR